MTQSSQFDRILFEILKRKRKSVPDLILTGKRFTSSSSEYNIIYVDKTVREKNVFLFTEPDPKEFWSLGSVNFKDFETELLYLKLFTKSKTNITQEINLGTSENKLSHMTKATSIIKITDFENKIFYMYIKLHLKAHYELCDDDNDSLNYRIVYSSSFDDLVTFIYKSKEIPDFLNSDAFISKEDKTIDQISIIKEHDASFIKNVEYSGNLVSPTILSDLNHFDGTINITVNFKICTITASTSKYTYSTKYKPKHESFVNEIITKGSNTISVKIFIRDNSIDIIIRNDIETLKSFCLKEVTNNTKCNLHKQINENEVEDEVENEVENEVKKQTRSYCKIQ